jgi:hypothetical protein
MTSIYYNEYLEAKKRGRLFRACLQKLIDAVKGVGEYP